MSKCDLTCLACEKKAFVVFYFLSSFSLGGREVCFSNNRNKAIRRFRLRLDVNSSVSCGCFSFALLFCESFFLFVFFLVRNRRVFPSQMHGGMSNF